MSKLPIFLQVNGCDDLPLVLYSHVICYSQACHYSWTNRSISHNGLIVWTILSWFNTHAIVLRGACCWCRSFLFGNSSHFLNSVAWPCQTSHLSWQTGHLLDVLSSVLTCQLLWQSSHSDGQVSGLRQSGHLLCFVNCLATHQLSLTIRSTVLSTVLESTSSLALTSYVNLCQPWFGGQLSGVLTNILSLSRKAGWNYYLVSCRDGLPLLSPSFLSRSLIILAFSRWDFPIVPWHQANSFCQSCLWRLTTCQSSGDRHSFVSSVMLSASQDRSVWQTA